MQLSSRRDPAAGTLNRIFERVRRFPKRVVFAEGEEEQVIRAALSYVANGLGTAILVGREERVRETAAHAGSTSARATASRSTMRASRIATRLTRNSSTSGCSGKVSSSAIASASSTRTATTSPPPWWRSAMPTPWSRA